MKTAFHVRRGHRAWLAGLVVALAGGVSQAQTAAPAAAPPPAVKADPITQRRTDVAEIKRSYSAKTDALRKKRNEERRAAGDAAAAAATQNGGDPIVARRKAESEVTRKYKPQLDALAKERSAALKAANAKGDAALPLRPDNMPPKQ